jgi:hypothetical protein
VKRTTAIAAAYAAITAVFVSPLVNYTDLGRASYEGDARLLIWTLAWDAHALLTGTPLFDADIYYPEPTALRYAEHHIGIGLFGVPLYAITANPVLTYWVLWLLAFPLNALAMHALAWRVTRDRLASFAAGCVYAFCFFRMHHAHGHIQLLWTWMFPLVPIALDDWLERPTAARAALAAALMILAALSSWYLAVFVALLGIACLVCLLPGRKVHGGHVLQAVAAGAIAAVVVASFARPYLGLTPGPPAEAAANAADIRSYLVPPTNTWIGQILERRTSVPTRWIWGEQTLYIGLAAFVLGSAGAARLLARGMPPGRDARLAAAVLIAGGIALALSFGPTATGLSPFDLVARVPGLSLLRAPARFALLVMMAVALLSALGVAWFREAIPSAARPAVVALLVLFFVESFVVAFPAGKPQPMQVPAVYRLLPADAGGAVLSLPTYRGTPEAFREADYLLFATAHWRNIVNGFGRQEPPAHSARMAVLAQFPSEESIALLRELEIRYVVMHTRRASELLPRAEGARTSDAVRLVHSADGDFLFEVR